MPDFHDPSTREMMEGWEYFDHPYKNSQTSFYRFYMDNGNEMEISDDNVLSFHAEDSSAMEFPMKSFAAAKEAADAILRGVEG